MQSNISDLSPGTTFYVRAFATTKYGTEYSNEVQITTKLGLPTMSPVTVSDVQPASVTLSSGIARAGDGSILVKGFCYSTSSSPDINDSIVTVNSNWTASVNGLNQNTKYYVRSFATTQYGTSYSEQATFTTTYNPVVFGSISVSEIGITSIAVSCGVSDYGGNAVYDEGFCISTNPNPTINNTRYRIHGPTSSMNISSLMKGTHYYIKRYVVNEVDTFYSEEIDASTLYVPDDALNGLFSISPTKQIVFSKSNVWVDNNYEYFFQDSQYEIARVNLTAKKTWELPWDMLSCYEAQDYSTRFDCLGPGWYLLNIDEWKYLLEQRPNAKTLIINNVVINGTHGAILLPDNWDLSSIPSAGTISVSSFSTLESKGAVYIPYAGQVQVGNASTGTTYRKNGIDEYASLWAYSTFDKYNPYYACLKIGSSSISYDDKWGQLADGYKAIRLVYVLY